MPPRQRGCKQSAADGGVGGARDEQCWKSLTTSQAQAAVSLVRLYGCVRVCRLAKPTSGLSSVCPTFAFSCLLSLGGSWDLLLFPRFRQFSDLAGWLALYLCCSDFYSTICVQIAALFQSALWLRWNLNWYFIHLLDNWKWSNQLSSSRSQIPSQV